MPSPVRLSPPRSRRPEPELRSLPLVSPLHRALFLKAQPYLAGLPPKVIAVLAEHSEECDFHAREVVYEEGAPPQTLFFLSTGSIRIQYGEPGAGAPIDIDAPGGVGLMEHLARSERPPAAWALEETQTLAVDLEVFMQLVEEDFILYQTIARTLSRAVLAARGALAAQRLCERGYPKAVEDAVAPESLDLVHKLVLVRQAPFFRDSSVTVLTELLRFQQPRRLEAGETIWHAGDPVRSMALVLDGHCASLRGEEPLDFPAGSMLGAWEVLSFEPRAETAIARRPSRLLEIDRIHFTDVLEDHFEFALDYLQKMAREAVALRSMPAERGQESG